MQGNNNQLTHDLWMRNFSASENASLPVGIDKNTLSPIGLESIKERLDAKYATDIKKGDDTIAENNCLNMRLKCILIESDQLIEKLQASIAFNTQPSDLTHEVMTNLNIMFEPFKQRLLCIKNTKVSCRDAIFNDFGTTAYIDFSTVLSDFSSNILSKIQHENRNGSEFVASILLKLMDLVSELVDLCDAEKSFDIINDVNGLLIIERSYDEDNKNCIKKNLDKNNICLKRGFGEK